MYRSFYKLRGKPFSLLPDPAFLYVSGKHRKALAKLRSGIMNRAGITLITGEIGSGKTTLIQHLIGELEREVTIGVINNIHSRFDDLLQWVLQAFEIEVADTSDVKLHRAFVSFVKEQTTQGRSALLFVDEAQNMSARVLEELRMLMNINVDYPSFQVVIAGQPELRGILERPDMRQFAQRIAVEHHLQALDAEETGKYIKHRLVVAGGDPGLFDPEACELIYHHSQGVPRLVNSLCDIVLEYGYEEKRAIIDGALVRDILNDRSNGRLLALIEHSASPHRTQMIDGGHAPPSTARTGTLEVVVENERSQEARHERKSNGVPAADDQPVNRGMHGGMSVSRPPTRERPESLDEALKALAEALDLNHT